MHHNPHQYLQCVGNAGIWRLLSVVGDNPAVREKKGGVSRQGDTLNRMIMSGTDDGGARGEKSPANTHIDQPDTYFAVDSSSYLVFKSKSSA